MKRFIAIQMIVSIIFLNEMDEFQLGDAKRMPGIISQLCAIYTPS